LRFLGLAIFGQHGLAIVVARLPSIDTIDENISHAGYVPDGLLPRRGRRLRFVQPLGELSTTQLFFHHGAIELPDHLGFGRLNHHLRRVAMPLREIAVAVTPVCPRDELPAPGLLQPPTAGAFVNLRPLVFRHHPLHLGKQFPLRGIAKGILQKHPLYVQLLELLDQQPLMSVVASQTIRRQNHDRIKRAPLGAVAEPIQRRPVQSHATDSFIYILMLR